MIQGREKQKKIKPIKQPTKDGNKQIRNVLGSQKQPSDSNMIMSIKQRKAQQNMIQTQQKKDSQINTLESICTKLLQEGNVQSFIDLFYISHECLPNVMEKKNYFGESLHIPENVENQTQQKLKYFQNLGHSLEKAEIRHQSLLQEKQASMNQYNSMAFNYEDQGHYVIASYFYNKVIEIANNTKNKQMELLALLGLGKCYDQTGDKDEAIEILEGGFDDAAILENKQQKMEMLKLIGKQLIEMYIKKASQCQKFDIAQGLAAYECALRIAQRCFELQSQARISHKIGELYYEEANFEESVMHQLNYLELLKRSLDQEFEKASLDQMGEKKDNHQERLNLQMKEMEAHASLAKCYLKMKDVEKAEEHLNNYHKMAKQSKAQNSVADSSYYLAKLFQEKGQKEKAVSFYQSYFQAAKSQKPDKKDRKLVDKARVTFAIAKGNRNIEKYIGILRQEDSLVRVLDWKIKRILK